MPFNRKIMCIKCDKTNTVIWHTLACGTMCNECFDTIQDIEEENKKKENAAKAQKKNATEKDKNQINPRPVPNHLKAPSPVAVLHTCEPVYFRGTYFQVGDIVSITDNEGDIYYAQLRGIMTDQYCEKNAVITWLLPTQSSPSPKDGFDPGTYIIGPEEDIPRNLDCMEFVMHPPSDYYKSRIPKPPNYLEEYFESAPKKIRMADFE